MKSKNWSYLAGIVDGEGNISITQNTRKNGWNQFQFLFSIKNTDLRLMQWLVENFGGVYYNQPSSNLTWKLSYSWRPKGRKNKEEILLGILPYLLLKKEQALLALEYVRLDPHVQSPRRREIAKRCTELNQRGKSVETNTLNSEPSEMIESDLIGDNKCAPVVTQVVGEYYKDLVSFTDLA